MTDDYTPDRQAASLRAAADFIVAHPGLPQPYITSHSDGAACVNYQLMLSARDGQKAAMAQITREVRGAWEKVPLGDTFLLRQAIGDLRIDVSAQRDEVCERRVVGTETVTIPAVEAQPEQTVERDVVEWDCAPILADEPVPYALAEEVRL